MNLSEVIEYERLEYKKTNRFFYFIYSILIFLSLFYILDINSDIASKIAEEYLDYFLSKTVIIFYSVIFIFLSLIDYKGYISSLTSSYIWVIFFSASAVFGIFFLGLTVMYAVTSPMWGPIYGLSFTTSNPVDLAFITENYSTIYNNYVDYLSYAFENFIALPLSYCISWIFFYAYRKSSYDIPLYFSAFILIVFNYLILNYLVFSRDQIVNFSYSFSDIFTFNHLHLEYLSWFILLMLSLKNTYILINESKSIDNFLRSFKWIILLFITIIGLNIFKSYYMINFVPDFKTSLLITILVWIINLSFENINILLSYINEEGVNNNYGFSNEYEVDVSEFYRNIVYCIVFINLIVVLFFINFYYHNIFNEILLFINSYNIKITDYVLYIQIALILSFLLIYLEEYDFNHRTYSSDSGMLNITFFLFLGFYLYENIDSLNFQIVLYLSVALIINFFANFFSKRENLLLGILIFYIILDNNIISTFLYEHSKYLVNLIGLQDILALFIASFIELAKPFIFMYEFVKELIFADVNIIFKIGSIIIFIMLTVYGVVPVLFLIYLVYQVIVFLFGIGLTVLALIWSIIKLILIVVCLIIAFAAVIYSIYLLHIVLCKINEFFVMKFNKSFLRMNYLFFMLLFVILSTISILNV